MIYRFLGKTGVKVSMLSYGTMSFGGDADEAMSEALFKACRDGRRQHLRLRRHVRRRPVRGDPRPPDQGLP